MEELVHPAEPRLRLFGLPKEIQVMIFEHFIHDATTLASIAELKPLTPAVETISGSKMDSTIRGDDAVSSCQNLLSTIQRTQDPESCKLDTLAAPVRHLSMVFHCGAHLTVPPEFGQLMQTSRTPALGFITIKLVDTHYHRRASGSKELRDLPIPTKTVRDYCNVLEVIRSRLLGPSVKIQVMPMHFELGTCYSSCIPSFVNQDPNFELRELEVNLVSGPISGDVRHSFMFARDTFTELSITEHTSGWIHPQRTQADFSVFPSLLHLRISSSVWFTSPDRDFPKKEFVWKSNIARSSVVHLLPTRLQKLCVDFAVGPGHRESLMCLYKTQAQKLNTKLAYNWILELVGSGTTPLLTDLKEVAVQEAFFDIVDQVMDWTLPKELTDALERAGVRLEVMLRKDRPLVPPVITSLLG